MLKLYYAPFTRAIRVRWLLEELGVPYALERIEFKTPVLKGEAHLARHPLGKVPVIEDGDLTLFESIAIMQYVVEKFGEGGLLPALGTKERALAWQWVHFGEASFATLAGDMVRLKFRERDTGHAEGALASTRTRFAAALGAIEAALPEDGGLVGTFSLADISVDYGILLAKVIGEMPEGFSRAEAFHARMQARPAYQAANA
jgi:glutathione S-transferase